MTRDTIVDFVTPVLWESMRGNVTITPRRQPKSPNHVEVYLPEQVMAVFKGQQLLLVTHISTGTNEKWCEEVTVDPGEEGNKGPVPIKMGICGEAITSTTANLDYAKASWARCGIRCISTSALQFMAQ
jgi:hypothetical protein